MEGHTQKHICLLALSGCGEGGDQQKTGLQGINGWFVKVDFQPCTCGIFLAQLHRGLISARMRCISTLESVKSNEHQMQIAYLAATAYMACTKYVGS